MPYVGMVRVQSPHQQMDVVLVPEDGVVVAVPPFAEMVPARLRVLDDGAVWFESDGGVQKAFEPGPEIEIDTWTTVRSFMDFEEATEWCNRWMPIKIAFVVNFEANDALQARDAWDALAYEQDDGYDY